MLPRSIILGLLVTAAAAFPVVTAPIVDEPRLVVRDHENNVWLPFLDPMKHAWHSFVKAGKTVVHVPLVAFQAAVNATANATNAAMAAPRMVVQSGLATTNQLANDAAAMGHDLTHTTLCTATGGAC